MSRNIVLISIDSLRADHCGHLGGPEDLTPALDQMAGDGVDFQNALAPGPKTPESMPAVFTGQQWRSDDPEFDGNSWRDGIMPTMKGRETIAERLSAAGYETIAYTPNGFTTEYFGFDQGFDSFQDFLDEEIRPGFDIPNAIRGLIKYLRKEGNWKTWERYYDDVVESARDADRPYFLWVFLLDVHTPYLVPREYRSENSWLDMMKANWQMHGAGVPDEIHDTVVSAYEDTVRYSDEFLRRIQTDLADDDPVYVVHSDHGEAFGDHGHYGHERLLYGENLQVPFFVANGGVEETIERPVSLTLVPELLDAIAADRLPSYLESLDRDAWRNPVVAHTEEGDRTAIRVGPLKYIANGDDEPELYDLSEDPEERADLAAERPAVRDVLADYEATVERAKAEEAAISSAAGDVAAAERL